MGRSHRLMSSLKLLASPPIDLATSSSSVHVMRSAEGPFSVVLRRADAMYGLLEQPHDADDTAPFLKFHFHRCLRVSSDTDRASMTYNQSVGAPLSTSELQTHASECDPQPDTSRPCP